MTWIPKKGDRVTIKSVEDCDKYADPTMSGEMVEMSETVKTYVIREYSDYVYLTEGIGGDGWMWNPDWLTLVEDFEQIKKKGYRQ